MEQEKLTGITYKIKETANRIRELREISGISQEEMAERTGISLAEYRRCEAGLQDLSIAFLYRCVLVFGVDMSDLLEGHSPKLRQKNKVLYFHRPFRLYPYTICFH